MRTYQTATRSFRADGDCVTATFSLAEMEDLIKCYFEIGFNNKEVFAVLAQNHNIVISVRTLKRRCRELGLFRRRNQSDIDNGIAFVQLRSRQPSLVFPWSSQPLQHFQCALITGCKATQKQMGEAALTYKSVREL